MMECFIVEVTEDHVWAFAESEPLTIDGVLYDVVEIDRVEGIAVLEKVQTHKEEKSDSQGD
jgi:hypothetical protein